MKRGKNLSGKIKYLRRLIRKVDKDNTHIFETLDKRIDLLTEIINIQQNRINKVEKAVKP
jgi:anaerobic ribonucleoside-triphosphate reductase